MEELKQELQDLREDVKAEKEDRMSDEPKREEGTSGIGEVPLPNAEAEADLDKPPTSVEEKEELQSDLDDDPLAEGKSKPGEALFPEEERKPDLSKEIGEIKEELRELEEDMDKEKSDFKSDPVDNVPAQEDASPSDTEKLEEMKDKLGELKEDIKTEKEEDMKTEKEEDNSEEPLSALSEELKELKEGMKEVREDLDGQGDEQKRSKKEEELDPFHLDMSDAENKKAEETIKEEIVDSSSSPEEAAEELNEKNDSRDLDLSKVDLEKVEADLEKDKELSREERDEAGEVVEKLQVVDKDDEDRISEEIGEVRQKLQTLRRSLKKEKEEGLDLDKMEGIESEIQLKQKQIHELSEERKEEKSKKEELLRDEKSESTLSEEIGEIRQVLQNLREDLQEEKQKGADEEDLKVIQSEIEVRQKEIHSLTEEREELKEERKAKTEDSEKREVPEEASEENGITDQQKVEGAEVAFEEGAEVVVKGSDGEVTSFDVVQTGKEDDSLILIGKDPSELDPEKPTLLLTDEGQSSFVSPQEIEKVLKEDEGQKSAVIPEVTETEKKPVEIKNEKTPAGRSVKVYPSWDQYIKEQFLELTGHGNGPTVLDEGKEHTASSYKLGDLPPTRSGTSKVVAVSKPEETLNVIEEKDGSKVVVKDSPSVEGKERIVPLTSTASELKKESKSPSAPPESMVIGPSAEMADDKKKGSNTKGLFTPEYTAVQVNNRAPFRRGWRQPRPAPYWIDDYDNDYDQDFEDSYDDYEIMPPRRRRRRGYGSRRRRRRYSRRGGRGRRRSHRRRNRWNDDVNFSYQEQRRQPGFERTYPDLLQDQVSDDDQIQQEQLVQQRSKKERGFRSEFPRRKGVRRQSETNLFRKTPKFDPEMEWAHDPEDTLGQWAADPIVKKSKVMSDELRPSPGEEEEKMVSLGSWAEDPIEEKTVPLGSWSEEPEGSEEPEEKETFLGHWSAEPIDEKVVPVAPKLPKQKKSIDSWSDDPELPWEEDVVDTSVDEAETDDEYFFQQENERGPVLRGKLKREHLALDKKMEKVWKTWAELMTIQNFLHKRGKRDPKIDKLSRVEGMKFEQLLKVHASKYGNPHPLLVPE